MKQCEICSNDVLIPGSRSCSDSCEEFVDYRSDEEIEADWLNKKQRDAVYDLYMHFLKPEECNSHLVESLLHLFKVPSKEILLTSRARAIRRFK